MTTAHSGHTVPRNQPEEALMAICNIIDDAERSAEEYERITAHVRGSGPIPPDGCRLVLLSRERAITVWESPEDRDRFLAEQLAPAYQAVGRSLDEVWAAASTPVHLTWAAPRTAWPALTESERGRRL
jgi:hypothetical protein